MGFGFLPAVSIKPSFEIILDTNSFWGDFSLHTLRSAPAEMVNLGWTPRRPG